MKNKKLLNPEGFRDFLPDAFREKRRICDGIMSTFESFGYDPVQSPMLEYVEVYGGKAERETYRFINRDGDILALRPDMTPAVARIAATHFTAADYPLRICYKENVFRFNESHKGKTGEFTEAGVELIGARSAEADAEIVALAVESLLSASLTDFRVDVGHVGFLSGLLEETGLCPEECEKIMECLINRDYVMLERSLANNEVSGNAYGLFTNLLSLTGGPEIIDEVYEKTGSERARSALCDLRKIYESVGGYGRGLCGYIRFDLGIIGHLDYYTGMLIRGYGGFSGFSILDGGRYDNLAANFGAEAASVGFAVKIDNLPIDNSDSGGRIFVGYAKDSRDTAVKAGHALRRKGDVVENALAAASYDECVGYAEKKNASRLLYFDGDTVKSLDMKSGDIVESAAEEADRRQA